MRFIVEGTKVKGGFKHLFQGPGEERIHHLHFRELGDSPRKHALTLGVLNNELMQLEVGDIIEITKVKQEPANVV